MEDNNKDNNNDKGISALGLDRDLGFSRRQQGCQGYQPHDDDDDEEEDDEVEENNKDDNNNKYHNNDKGISALELDGDLFFCEDIKGLKDNGKDDVNNKDDNNDKGITALGLDRDLGFSREHQRHCR